jgi:transcription initiation factor TFIID TATA-box-binding protein
VDKIKYAEKAKINSNRIIIHIIDMNKFGYEFRGSITLFESGKMLVLGTKSFKGLYYNVMYLIAKLIQNGVQLPYVPILEVVNVVFTSTLGVPINLDELSFILTNVDYDTDTFPGAIYNIEEPRSAILIFTTGRVVIVGLLDEKDAQKVLNQLKEELVESGFIDVI